MPTYVYHCDGCSDEFEVDQSIKDAPIEECPDCGARVHRVIQPTGVILKGPGFHVNDYPSR